MRIQKLNLVQITVTLVILMVIPTIVHAQDPGLGADAPLDGGVSILIAAGVGYGIKKLKEHKMGSKKNEVIIKM